MTRYPPLPVRECHGFERKVRALTWVLALLVSLSSLAAQADPVAPLPEPPTFNVLSYNTHGLPAWIAGDDPEGRFPEISTRLNGYQVALIQEDWNFHELLTSRTEHEVVERGNGPATSTRAAFGLNGAGLSSLAAFGSAQLLEVTREPLGACAGWLGGANDCLASKGFLRLRLQLDDGAVVDFYNTHLDAGGADSDREARRQQLETLAERIRTLTGDGALVIGGDFNCASNVPEDAALLKQFREDLGLSDTGARGPGERHLDYLFYRAGSDGKLTLVEAGEAEEFVWKDVPLSDHPAIFARFTIR